MDRFFPEKLLGEIFWDIEPLSSATNQSDFVQHSQIMSTDQPCPPANPGAFVQYRDLPRNVFGEESSLNGSNSNTMNRRMLAFLRKSWPVERNKVAVYERERGFRHMINERMRRQRLRQCCLDLHSMLPHGTKTDNNSVVQTAAKEIQRLQGCREELQRENFELEAKLEAVGSNNKVGGSKFQYLRVPYPTSGIDSLAETLKYLKDHGVDTRSIKSSFSQQELFAVLEMETEIAGSDVERDIQRTLDDLDWNLHSHVPAEAETLKCLKGQGVDTRSIKSSFSQQELFAVLEMETEVVMWKGIFRTLAELEWKLYSHVPAECYIIGKG